MKKTLLLTALLLSLYSFPALATTLTVGSTTAKPGDTISIPITIDTPELVAGATFKISYSSTNLTLNNIRSNFFTTFSDQWQLLNPAPDPLPPTEVTVDGTVYNRPLVYNAGTIDTIFIAAARIEAGASETTMFTLDFTVKNNAVQGIHAISISSTRIDNEAAGYPAGGADLPLLIGLVEGDSTSYPAIPTDVVGGAVTINMTFVDSDQDNIADDWEIAQFGNLTTANSTSDYDKDGYSDLQEYLNSTGNILDPDNQVFDPKTANTPHGVGYIGKNLTPVLMLLLNNNS